MMSNMKAYLTTHLAVALHACIFVCVVIMSAWYVSATQKSVEVGLSTRINGTTERIQTLAELTDRNEADALTERIITDCPRRAEFDEMLNTLGSATRKELMSVQQLFDSCGAFYAERKALMVAQLQREFELLTSDLALMATLRDLSHHETQLSRWNDLILLEGERSAFLTEQTQIQSDIISLLIEGGSRERINELVRQAENVSQSLIVTDARIDALRSELTS